MFNPEIPLNPPFLRGTLRRSYSPPFFKGGNAHPTLQINKILTGIAITMTESIKAIRASVQIGALEVDGFMLLSGVLPDVSSSGSPSRRQTSS